MSFLDFLGRTVTLRVLRILAPGAFLGLPDETSPDGPAILLPTREVPPNAQPFDLLDVFVYLDSEDRLIATARRPHLELGEVRFLMVTDLTRYGAFFDWGLVKELLVPFAGQIGELAPGQIHPIGLLRDRSDRLCGTMRVRGMLQAGGRFVRDELVEGEAWREEPGVGVFCILERKYVGLLPAREPHGLRRGEHTTFRVAHVMADGKIELSLRGHVHEEITNDAERVLEVLAGLAPGQIGDRSSPEQIRTLFGLSKKAFKRAVGRLLRDRAVALDARGCLVPPEV